VLRVIKINIHAYPLDFWEQKDGRLKDHEYDLRETIDIWPKINRAIDDSYLMAGTKVCFCCEVAIVISRSENVLAKNDEEKEVLVGQRRQYATRQNPRGGWGCQVVIFDGGIHVLQDW